MKTAVFGHSDSDGDFGSSVAPPLTFTPPASLCAGGGRERSGGSGSLSGEHSFLLHQRRSASAHPSSLALTSANAAATTPSKDIVEHSSGGSGAGFHAPPGFRPHTRRASRMTNVGEHAF
uniref:Uncharacterized protein n=1 Tax=Ditylenchus dipsaci TaxID=166011 RepID=A0A915D016_9BILA